MGLEQIGKALPLSGGGCNVGVSLEHGAEAGGVGGSRRTSRGDARRLSLQLSGSDLLPFGGGIRQLDDILRAGGSDRDQDGGSDLLQTCGRDLLHLGHDVEVLLEVVALEARLWRR